jgi:hypothetical protein
MLSTIQNTKIILTDKIFCWGSHLPDSKFAKYLGMDKVSFFHRTTYAATNKSDNETCWKEQKTNDGKFN